MSTKLTSIIPLLIALISGALAWQQRQSVVTLTRQVTSLSDEAAERNEVIGEQAALLDRFQEENEVYKREFASLRDKSTRTSPITGAHDRENKTFTTSSETAAAKMFSKMAKDPKLKEVTRQWQIARIKRLYGDFVRARGLNPQQAKQFFDLLVNDDTRTKEEGAELLRGGEREVGANEAKAKSWTQEAEIEKQLKLLLGANNYAEYEDYKKTTGPRLTVLEIQGHFARTGAFLRADQANTLLQIMLEERDLNQPVLDRMKTVLTPEQYQELQSFQDENLKLQSVRIEAVLELMERKNSSATPPVAPAPSP